ncbi:site-specific tyrosine recombinase XerC [Caulifigura coniformis]|uniref:Site-specific tyrosine recombinase XerC n=1 Tax=Caulifigura coniformis TaxID=2527983 RepID=A0A517SHA0_9PLAN|nr:site-specific integrase [Caulifigura coniformis]QDT55500.1 site-specific tyrosine recombinase XerC [Caulifigura coniformis]
MSERKPFKRKLSDGCFRWYVLWNGRQQWLGRDEAEAQRNLERLKAGEAVVSPKQQAAKAALPEYVDKFLDWTQANKPARYDACRFALRPFVVRFEREPVAKLSRRKVEAWISEQPNPFRTRRAVVRCFKWLVNNGHVPSSPLAGMEITVSELVDKFLEHANRHYVKRGKVTSEVNSIKMAVAPLVDLFGDLPASQFGPVRLEKVRTAMIARGWCRSAINQHCGRIRRVFKRGVRLQLIQPRVLEALKALEPLLHGRTEAVEAEPVEPVSETTVEATIPHLPPMIVDMIRVHRLTGMRPGEVCSMDWTEIDTSGAVWVYRPTSHKLEHHNRKRVIAIGPQAQAVLMKYRGFGPVWPGKNGAFTTAAYRRAITRGCEFAFGMPKELRPRGKALKELTAEQREDVKRRAEAWREEHTWHPNQLRHSFATELRKSETLDVVAATLGHSRIATSELYAELNLAAATAVVAKIG